MSALYRYSTLSTPVQLQFKYRADFQATKESYGRLTKWDSTKINHPILVKFMEVSITKQTGQFDIIKAEGKGGYASMYRLERGRPIES